jgi:hypothetical protein
LRTIYRILGRAALFRARRAQGRRRPSPPQRGWYLPDAAHRRVELDSFDIILRLITRDRAAVELLNGVSLHGGLTMSRPVLGPVTAVGAVETLINHWRAVGLPAYAQFDNDPVFQGTHNSPVAVGRVSRLCLSLAVVPVFVPPGEIGFQAMVEGYNRWWRARVWTRFGVLCSADLWDRSERYVTATRCDRAARISAAPARRPFPAPWHFDVHAPPRGRIIFLRRTNDGSELRIFGRLWAIPRWPGRLVRVELNLTEDRIRVFTLERAHPERQPLVLDESFRLPLRRFQG